MIKQTKIKTNIAFDIDGVVINFVDAFLRTAKKVFKLLPNTEFSDIKYYKFWNCLDITRDTTYKIVNYVINNPLECSVQPVNYAPEVLTELSKYMNLVFVTARESKSENITKETIYFLLPKIEKSKITIIHQKGSKKSEILKKLNINYFIDDRTKNVRILNQNGIKAFLFNSPWNEQTRNTDFFTRINTWKEIKNLIKKL